MIKCDALRDLLPLVQFKKREKTPIEECSACIFTKSNSPPWVFFHVFFNCTNGTKSRKTSQIDLFSVLLSILLVFRRKMEILLRQ